MRSARTLRQRWLFAWIGGASIGVGNGVVREATYGRRLGDASASRLSVLTAVAAFAAYFRLLQRRWPLARQSEALKVGGAWLGMTVAFEFGFGRLVAKKPWRELIADYDIARGRLWPLVLAWIALGPEIARRSVER
ncbi:MAG TPA: hypothetical protein VFX85_06650 [Solirubrobacterales bacterium]|nr:hypothetical protein [Solirubrobacterales bacterium]